ncbi:MAG: hypothetical protein PHF86_08340 [Candidatus Nanoarchaeia archaeon]|nr:hypothetical protein [Candidatus Nanoarchaeia archaeon]
MSKKAIKKKKVSVKKVIPKKVPKKVVEKPQELTVSKKELEDLVAHMISKDAAPVIDQLLKRKNVSEFTLAEKLKMSINQFRNIIYKLDAHNLVSSTRKKDKQKGWYVYYWTFYPERLEKLYWNLKRRKLEKLKKRFALEQHSDFYVCPNKCTRVSANEGMELNFRCPECGKLLQEDKFNTLKKLTQEIENLEAELTKANQLIVS